MDGITPFRVYVLVAICLLPACSQVQPRDVAVRTERGHATIAENGTPQQSSKRLRFPLPRGQSLATVDRRQRSEPSQQPEPASQQPVSETIAQYHPDESSSAPDSPEQDDASIFQTIAQYHSDEPSSAPVSPEQDESILQTAAQASNDERGAAPPLLETDGSTFLQTEAQGGEDELGPVTPPPESYGSVFLRTAARFGKHEPSSAPSPPEIDGSTIVQVSAQFDTDDPEVAPPPLAIDATITQPTSAQDHPYEPDLVPPAPDHDGGAILETTAPAQLGFPEAGGISLDELEQLALSNNPTLLQAAWSVDKACGLRNQAGRYPNPTVGYQGIEMGNEGSSGQQGAFLQQTIVLGDKLRLGQRVIDQDLQRLLWTKETQRLRVLTDLRLRFYEALGAQRRVELAGELEKVAADGVKAAQELFEAQQGAKPDILQAEIQLNEVRIILQNAQTDYDTAWRGLVSVVGMPSMQPVRLEGDIRGELPVRELEADYEQLVSQSPEVQVAYANVERARANVRRQRAQPIPNLITQFGVAHDNATGDEIANVQIGVPLPLLNRNRGNVAAAHAEYHRAWQNVERLRLSLRVRLNEAFRNYVQARNQVERIKSEILPRAEENRELTEDAYQLGEFDFLRVLTARRTYFEANLRYVRELIQLRKANTLIDGLLLTGGLESPAEVQIGSELRGQALSGQ
jgi:cobalt-zinc-cadmium efflux system outer membrane protein